MAITQEPGSSVGGSTVVPLQDTLVKSNRSHSSELLFEPQSLSNM